MTRILDAFSQFFDGNGQPLSNGKLNFFQNKTAIPQETFNDPEQTILNPVDLPLDGEGKMTLNAYASVLCTVKLFNSADSQVDSFDDVSPRGGLSSGNSFDDWNPSVNYKTTNSVVTGSDDNYYKAKQNSTGIDPVVDFASGGENWERVFFNEFWSSFKTYSDKDRVIFSGDSNYYISVVSSNIGNDPSVDTGSNWVLDNPVLDWVIGRTYEIDEQSYSKVDLRRYASQLLQSGNEPSADATNWLPIDGIVKKPVNDLPADLATGVSRTPTLTSEAYVISGSAAAHEYSRYQVFDDVGLTNLVYDSQITTDLESNLVPVKLEAATQFFWHTLHKGTRTDLSEFSDATSFTTTIDFTKVFDNITFTGTGATLSVSSSVDLNTNAGGVWIANLTTTGSMRTVNTIRGAGDARIFDGSAFNTVTEATGLTSFDTAGFTVGADANYNGSGNNIYSLAFKIEPGICDIVTYSGNGTNRTIAHNVTEDIGLLLVVQTSGAAPGASPATRFWLKPQGGAISYAWCSTIVDRLVSSGIWNSTQPTSSVFSLGTDERVNGSGRNYEAYLFAHNPAAGLFAGTYTGTGSPGNKIVTGFPVGVFLLLSNTVDRDVIIYDSNLGTASRIVFTSNCQSTAGGPLSFDSDGITLTGDISGNASGESYAFFAWADGVLF